MTTRDGKLKQTPISKSTPELMGIYQRISVAKASLEDFEEDYVLQFPLPSI